MGHGSYKANLVHQLGKSWQPIADLDPRNSGALGFEFPPDFQGGIGFHVPQVDMAGAAKKEKKNARVFSSLGSPRGWGRLRLQPRHVRLVDPKQAQPANTQQFPPRFRMVNRCCYALGHAFSPFWQESRADQILCGYFKP